MFPDTKHVKRGKLVAASPSSIEMWDQTTAFGCQRKWHFAMVQGIPQPSTGNQQLGTDLHTFIENYLEAADVVPSDLWGAKPEAHRLFLAVKPVVDAVRHEGIVSVEDKITLSVADVQINGRIDLRTKSGILDWKTSSDVQRYAKTPGQLRRSTQMLLYAEWLRRQNDAPAFPLTLEHVYVQTKGKPIVERVSARIDRGSLDVGLDGIILLLEEMKGAAAEPDASKLQADRSKCRQCPYQTQCNASDKKDNPMASLLNRLNAASTPASVLPPDAPTSKPELAADPVEGFSPIPPPRIAAVEVDATPTAPVPETPKKRGRPPGAKARPKIIDVPEAVVAKNPETESSVEYSQVTIAFGATIPTAQFANQRLDVTLTARFAGDVDRAAAEVSEKVRSLVVKELEKISLTLNGPALKP